MLTQERKLIEEQVAAVSRSFAFVINQLRDPLKTEIQIGYLLFRLGDNLEDTSSLSVDEKRELFEELIAAFRDNRAFTPSLDKYQDNPWQGLTQGEIELFSHTDKIIAVFSTLSEKARESLLREAVNMFRGMEKIQQEHRTPDGKYVRLKNTDELNEYCYYVAGTVGDYLTERFLDAMPYLDDRRIHLLNQTRRSVALTLQVTNITRDIKDDYENNHIFYPAELIDGFDTQTLLAPENQTKILDAGAEMAAWLYPSLIEAEKYISQIPLREHRIRLFVIIPYAMALKTLGLTLRNPDIFKDEPVKITRSAVKRTFLMSKAAACSNIVMTLWFNSLRDVIRKKIKPYPP